MTSGVLQEGETSSGAVRLPSGLEPHQGERQGLPCNKRPGRASLRGNCQGGGEPAATEADQKRPGLSLAHGPHSPRTAEAVGAQVLPRVLEERYGKTTVLPQRIPHVEGGSTEPLRSLTVRWPPARWWTGHAAVRRQVGLAEPCAQSPP